MYGVTWRGAVVDHLATANDCQKLGILGMSVLLRLHIVSLRWAAALAISSRTIPLVTAGHAFGFSAHLVQVVSEELPVLLRIPQARQQHALKHHVHGCPLQ